MPFTFTNYQPLTPEQLNPLSAALEAYGKGTKALYTPMTTAAEAASKMAYANLMGPQFIAKLMGNENLLANLDNPQQLLSMITNAGTGQTQTTQGLRQRLLGGGGGSTGAGMGFGNNYGGGNGGQTYGGQPASMPQSTQNKQPNQQRNYQDNLVSQAMRAWYESPQTQEQIRTQGYATAPNQQQILDWYQRQQTQQQAQQPSTQQPVYEPEEPGSTKTFAEKSGEFAGVKEQGKEAGKYRAEDVKEFGKQIQAGMELGDKFKGMGEILTDPEFIKMRSDVPLFQGTQLSILSKTGTPAQQKLIGDFIATSNQIIGDTINSFSGNKLTGEVDISRDMKIGKSDTLNVALGKLEAAELYKELKMQRASIASDLMEDKHLSKKKALEIADKQINGDEIRKKINKKLDYQVQVREIDIKTGKVIQTKMVPVSEARKMGVPNV